MKRIILTLCLLTAWLASCAPVDLNAPVPVYESGVDPEAWVTIPASEFLSGQHDDPVTLDYDYEIMVTDVTVAQYVAYLNSALVDGTLKVSGEELVGYYPGDEFRGIKHELEIAPGDYLFVPLNDPAIAFYLRRLIVLGQRGVGESPDDQCLVVRIVGLLRQPEWEIAI